MTRTVDQLLQTALRSESDTAVRRRLFRQLLASLVYEDAIRTRTDPAGRTVVDGVDTHGAPVQYRFTAHRRYGFDRVSIGPEPVSRVQGDREAEADSLTRFLAEVSGALTAETECLTRFARELEETRVKDSLALAWHAQREVRLQDADYDVLEGAIIDGHRYHPAYKSRIGFDLEDNLAYGPEFAHPIRPLWLAVDRTLATVAVAAGYSEAAYLGDQLGATPLDTFRARIAEAGRDPEQYTLLPVHPWQWREQVATGFAEQIRHGQLLMLGADPHTFLAQQSIRTLGCVDVSQRPNLKLALSIVNTSTSRVLAPHTVANAPVVSDWLAQVVANDGFLRDEARLVIQREVMGSVVDPPAVGDFTRQRTYGTLACIWRESLHQYVGPDEHAVPFTGLTACDVHDTPLIDPWVRRQGVETWLDQVVEISAVPLLHLLCRHGIALESHAQNMVLLHRDGWPTRVALKDFHDGVRFSRDHLADPTAGPPIAPPPAHHVNANSFLETNGVGLVTDFLLDAFFFVNLGELSLFLADRYEFPERVFWSIVRDSVRRYQKRFPELADRFRLFGVFKPTLRVEKLTTRRLLPDIELRLHPVTNPLAEPGGMPC